MDTYKLLSFHEGRFSLEEAALEKLLIPFTGRKQITRLAILAFTGPPGSGKSFYTNLLNHYLDNKSFEWLTEFSDQKGNQTKPLQGFQFGTVTGSKYAVPDNSDSGIYVWSKLFNVKIYGGRLAVCVLHQHQSRTDKTEQPNVHLQFDYLLHTICSRVIEIRRQKDKFADYSVGDLKLAERKYGGNSDIFRLAIISKTQDGNGSKEISKSPSGIQTYSYNVAYINESEQPLHTDSGHLTLTEDLHAQIDIAIKLIAETNNVCLQHDEKNMWIILSEMKTHFQSCVNFVNSCIENNKLLPYFNKSLENGNSNEGRQLQLEGETAARNAEEDDRARARKESEKAKEIARKLEEERINLLVDNIFAEVESRIVSHLENWLNRPNLLSNFGYCQSIYRYSVDETLSPKVLEMSKMDNVTIRLLLGRKFKTRKIELEKIHESISHFHMLVNTQMMIKVCFPQDQLVKELSTYIHTEKANGNMCKYAEFGCKKLEFIYLSQNELIAASEDALISLCKKEILTTYDEIMVGISTPSPCHPALLTQGYHSLLKVIHAQLKTIQAFQDNLVSETPFIHLKLISELKICLKQIYLEYRQWNAQKLKQLYNLVKPVVLRFKGEYCNDLEKILKESPSGIPKETLFKQNVAVHDIVKEKLCQEIRSIIGENEPTEGYLKSLACEIESVWQAFQDLNNERLNALSENVSSSSSPLSPERKTLSPILFKLSLSRIGTYFCDETKYLNFGYSSTIVGETCHGILVCEQQYDNKTEKPKFERSWNLSDLLLPEKQKANTDELIVEGTSHKIKTELILGLLLKSLKQKVETHLNGDANACVISVPFWLTSYQRQQVKDSGMVAGFQDTYLINENSAIALYICSFGTDEDQNDIVVLSENSGRVDSTIYSYEKLYSCIKTTGHCGVYEIETNMNASITNKISESYKIAQKINDEKLRLWNSRKPKSVAVAYESEEYQDMLVKVGKEVASKKAIRVEGDIMIIQGAHLFSQNISTNNITLQDWLSANIYRKIGENRQEQVQEKKDCDLYSEVRNVHSSFNLLHEIAYFFQKDMNGRNSAIACLKLDLPKLKRKVEVNLEISKESIINVTVINNGDKNVILNQRKLDAAQIVVYKSLLDSLKRMEVEIEKRNKRKQELIQQGAALLDRASKGQFLSSLAQEMALNQIQEALKLLSHPKITASDTEKQTELFEKYEKKFASQD